MLEILAKEKRWQREGSDSPLVRLVTEATVLPMCFPKKANIETSTFTSLMKINTYWCVSLYHCKK